MSEKQVENKEVTVETLQKVIDEQNSRILTLSRETERVKRNSRIMLISCVIMVFIVGGFVSATQDFRELFRNLKAKTQTVSISRVTAGGYAGVLLATTI